MCFPEKLPLPCLQVCSLPPNFLTFLFPWHTSALYFFTFSFFTSFVTLSCVLGVELGYSLLPGPGGTIQTSHRAFQL